MNFKLILNVSSILLCLNASAVHANGKEQWAETDAVITTNLGQVLVDNDGMRYVFFGKDIDAVWAVDADNNVIDSAWVSKSAEEYSLHWATGHTATYSGFERLGLTVTGEVPDLIHKYTSLIGKPLKTDLGPLPKGAVFNSFWFVVVGEDQKHWQWRSQGNNVVVTSPDGQDATISIDILLDNIQKGQVQ